MQRHDLLRSETEVDLARQIRSIAGQVRELAAQLDAMRDLGARMGQARELYALLFSAGVHQVEASPRAGGYGLGFGPRLVLFEELARADAGSAMALLSTANGAARAEAAANAMIRQRILGPCLSDTTGRFLLSVPGTEPDRGSDAMNFVYDRSLSTRARAVSGGYEVTGEKWMLNNCGTAAAYLVAVQLEGQQGFAGRAYAFIEAGSDGVSTAPVEKRGLRTAFQGRLQLNRVRVPKPLLLKGPRLSKAALREQTSVAVASHVLELGALSCGVAQAALDVTRAHVETRVQGGKRLIEHQAVALRLAEVAQALGAARALTREGAQLADAQALGLAAAARARAAAVEASRLACARGLDLVGSPGVLESHPLSKLSRDADTLSVPVASSDLLRLLGALNEHEPFTD
ncbi:MAG: acyl-CoA/acyl-ACP dehydrogenase [Archangiaceae bacterium]|nr:acyl-CoA/acyl-ACP dehydrogenase [Archangiaceae bacterium]